MKYLIASDIHGSAKFCEALLTAYDREGADFLVLLGDLLYHGPRNPLPEGYAPREVAELLNARRNAILCVRGNCDAEVDQLLLKFPMMSDSMLIQAEGTLFYCEHGHRLGPDAMPPLREGALLLCGHTHIPGEQTIGGASMLNPGSVSLPKEGSPRSYMTYEAGRVAWKTLEGTEFLRRDARG